MNLEAADFRGRLRQQSDVADHRDTGFGDSPNGGDHLDAAFQLHRRAAALFYEAVGGVYGLLGALVIRAEGEVSDHQCSFCSAHDGFYVMDHVFQRDEDGGFVPEHDHP